jgi:hypothetical protein
LPATRRMTTPSVRDFDSADGTCRSQGCLGELYLKTSASEMTGTNSPRSSIARRP